MVDPHLALKAVALLKEQGFVVGPATLAERFVILQTNAPAGTTPTAFIAAVKERYGRRLLAGVARMLPSTMVNLAQARQLVVRFDLGTKEVARDLLRDLRTVLEDNTDLLSRRLKFVVPFPSFTDWAGTVKLVCAEEFAKPGGGQGIRQIAARSPAAGGAVAIWVVAADGRGCGRFSGEEFKSYRTAAKAMVVGGIRVSEDRPMVDLGRRLLFARAASLVADRQRPA